MNVNRGISLDQGELKVISKCEIANRKSVKKRTDYLRSHQIIRAKQISDYSTYFFYCLLFYENVYYSYPTIFKYTCKDAIRERNILSVFSKNLISLSSMEGDYISAVLFFTSQFPDNYQSTLKIRNDWGWRELTCPNFRMELVRIHKTISSLNYSREGFW